MRRCFPYPALPSFCRLLAWFLLALSPAAFESAKADTKPSLTGYGDVRLRFEQDWDSQNASGAQRDDRLRGRYRVRLGANWKLDESWSGGARLRSGSSRSQQSPHLTFVSDPGGSDELDGVLDKYFVQFKEGDYALWAGRNSFPFWKQNEYSWDDDVTPTGVAASFGNSFGVAGLTTTVGGFALPDGGWGFGGTLLSGQVKYSKPHAAGNGQLTLALGMHRLEGDSGAKELLSDNGARDYLLGNLSAQWQSDLEGRRLSLGIDLFKNFEGYDSTELAPFSARQRDDDFGCVLSAQWGQVRRFGDWQVGYHYAYIETFAVNASYAQDDWVRFGTATQTAGSDCKGHEFLFSYGLSESINLVSRLFIVDSITSIQDGKRFRLDLNYKF